MLKKKWARFLMASLCLIFLTSACATSKIPAGFHAAADGTTQCIDKDGARDIGKMLEERRLCLDRLGRQPSVWDRFSSGFTIFGIGIATGAIGTAIILP